VLTTKKGREKRIGKRKEFNKRNFSAGNSYLFLVLALVCHQIDELARVYIGLVYSNIIDQIYNRAALHTSPARSIELLQVLIR
jgi:hypothetical protein